MNAPDSRLGQAITSDTARRPPRVGVFGHYGDRNLGDEAIIESIITRLRSEWVHAQIVAFSIDPQDTAARYGVTAHPIRQSSGEPQYRQMQGRTAARVSGTQEPLAEAGQAPQAASLLDRAAACVPKGRVRTVVGQALRGVVAMGREAAFVVRSTWRVRHLDAMFISGSNQFLDNFGGALGFPYTLLKWSLMCRLMGCRVYIVSTGAGPLEQRLSHYMARAALRLCDYASFRDLGSMELIEQRVARGVGLLAPDLAHGLRVAQPAGRAAAAAARTLRVGINPMPIYDPRFWPQHDSDKYQRYVRQHALFALELQSRGHDVFFYSTHFPDADVALDIAAQMKQLSPADGEAPTIRMPATVPELMDLIVGTDVVVATRFHGILLALHAWRPVIGICYFRKSRDLMQRFGQDDSAIAVDDLDARGLLQRFDHLQANRASVFERIRREDLKLQDQLEHQFAELAARLRRMTG